ncbi:hypothetical protein CMO88_00075 [Candidatus Woesearchaeota archaeon]|nr:hypothetical protein [Candidatus Woesearchaeota archaeon]|tara:strand:- start:15377 stop:16333 length:957 start_codon:yes stop_codon:yes gene_type:complete
MSIGAKVNKNLRDLGNQNGWKIMSCNFSIVNIAEKELFKTLNQQFPNYTILHKVRVLKNNEKFEADFIVFNNEETLWFEITSVNNTSSFNGNLDMRVLRIKELLKPTKVIMIRKIHKSNSTLIRYSKLMRLGIFTCSIDEIVDIRKIVEKQENLLNYSKLLLYQPIKSGKDLHTFRLYCLSMAKKQLAAILNIDRTSLSRLECKLRLPKNIILRLSKLQTLLKYVDNIRYLHRWSNSRRKNIVSPDERIINQVNFKHGMEKNLHNYLQNKFEIYHNVVLSNPNVTITSEADLYIPFHDIVIACKNSINKSPGTFDKIL